MARSVYYDPFGSRVQGFHAGMQDEMALQDNIRRAREQDFAFQNIRPLELRAAQRQDVLGQAGLPYGIRALDINEDLARSGAFTAGLGARGAAGNVTGQYQPAFGYGQQFLGLPQTQATPEQLTGIADYINWDRLYQSGTGAQNEALQRAQFGLNERQQRLEELQYMYPSIGAQIQALMYGTGKSAQGAGYNPLDFGIPQGQPTPQQTAPQQTQAPAYQYPVPQVLQPYGVRQQNPIDEQGRPGAEAAF